MVLTRALPCFLVVSLQEANDDLQFLPVFGNVIEYSYQTLIGAASYVYVARQGLHARSRRGVDVCLVPTRRYLVAQVALRDSHRSAARGGVLCGCCCAV